MAGKHKKRDRSHSPISHKNYERESSRHDIVASRDKHKRSESSRSRKNKSRNHSRSQSPSRSHGDPRSRKEFSKHSHKKRKRKYNRSSDSSSDGDSSPPRTSGAALIRQLELDRQSAKEEKIKLKESMKKMETPEEKRLRRLQKKEAKERKLKEQMGWDSEYLHFTNSDNPYGDNNLLETFLWKRKLEKEGKTNFSREDIEKMNHAKMEENRQELEKVKKRRLERELERQDRDSMMELEQRQREAAQFSHFSQQEDQFQLEQARLRSLIRIQDGRAKPIDLLAHYVSSQEDVTAVDVHEPYIHLTGLTLKDLEDLLEDIKVYQRLEQDVNLSYWSDLTTIVQDELRRLRHRDPQAAAAEASLHRQGIHSAVASEVSSVFQNKSLQELTLLQRSIEDKLAGPTAGLDVGYWESLLSQLKAHQARARLRERHRENLKKKLELLKAEQGVKDEGEEELEEGDEGGASEEEEELVIKPVKEEMEGDEEENKGEWDSSDEADAILNASMTAYTASRFSPLLIPYDKLEPGTVVLDEAEDEQRLGWARQRVVGTGQQVENVLTAEEKAMQREAQKTMSGDEVQFSVEAKLAPQHYLWSDKYRPRKPRYFNRVHTGFEWNKYNQTHYDMDNPPPKIVQGYKFNIFYPDLIDRSKPPSYDLIPVPDNRDFAILRFTAGPPYEDIAFKVVSREWEYSYKRGFRCQFHNNIFQLWFHFKRYRYRR